jgi:hypothetical protein
MNPTNEELQDAADKLANVAVATGSIEHLLQVAALLLLQRAISTPN